jgi:hypothetical protein
MILADTGHSHLEDAIEKLHQEMKKIMKAVELADAEPLTPV